MATEAQPYWTTLLYKRFPTLKSHQVVTEIVQSNAVGLIIDLQHQKKHNDEDDDIPPSRVFVKHVQVADYVQKKKDWADLRRTLVYGRTEVRFYRDVLPRVLQHHTTSTAVPRVWDATARLDDWIDPSVPANAPAGEPPVQYIDTKKGASCDENGAWLILDCIADTTHYQASPLTPSQAKQCIAAVAKGLHAAAWEQNNNNGDSSLAEYCQTQLSRASFALPLRNPKELEGMEEAWERFAQEFTTELVEAGLSRDSLRDLGRRTQRMASYVSDQVLPQAGDPFCTLIHGDYKAMNVFLPKDEDKDSALLVDFASCGIGLGMSDVAMHIHHAVLPKDLADGGEESLVRYYWETLTAELPEVEYDWETAWNHYRLGVVDYFRFFLGRMWKDATHETMAKKANNPNINNINRFPEAAAAFCCRADRYLREIELAAGPRIENVSETK